MPFLSSSFPGAYASLNAAVLAHIASASASIDVAMYKLKDARVAAALNERAAAGVVVRVLVDATENARIAVDGRLVRVYPRATKLHAKFMIVDGRTLLMGSLNYGGALTSGKNEDVLAILDDEATVGDAARTFEALFARGTPPPTRA